MNVMVAYSGKTGFTERYGQWISLELNVNAVNYSRTGGLAFDEVDFLIYGGRVRAGRIAGLRSALNSASAQRVSRVIVFATGAAPAEDMENQRELWENNLTAEELTTIPHYYFQGGLNYERMPVVERALMRLLAAVMRRRKGLSEADACFAKAVQSSFDASNREAIAPLVERACQIIQMGGQP